MKRHRYRLRGSFAMLALLGGLAACSREAGPAGGVLQTDEVKVTYGAARIDRAAGHVHAPAIHFFAKRDVTMRSCRVVVYRDANRNSRQDPEESAYPWERSWPEGSLRVVALPDEGQPLRPADRSGAGPFRFTLDVTLTSGGAFTTAGVVLDPEAPKP